MLPPGPVLGATTGPLLGVREAEREGQGVAEGVREEEGTREGEPEGLPGIEEGASWLGAAGPLGWMFGTVVGSVGLTGSGAGAGAYEGVGLGPGGGRKGAQPCRGAFSQPGPHSPSRSWGAVPTRGSLSSSCTRERGTVRHDVINSAASHEALASER